MFFFKFQGKTKEHKASSPPKKKERWKIGLPEIGETFYFPIQHIYYDERDLPREEYLITQSKVTGYYRGGYTEIRLSDGKTPRYFKKDAVEKSIFRKKEDAIAYAEKLADHYDSVWEKIEGKMRRGWRMTENCYGCKYLDRYKVDGRGYCCMVERSKTQYEKSRLPEMQRCELYEAGSFERRLK